MDDARLVGDGQRLAHLVDDLAGAADFQGAAVLDRLADIGAVDELHGEEMLPALLADGEAADDIGMIKPGADARLADETRNDIGIARQVRRQQLEGHLAVEADLPGVVDHAHPALAQFLDDLEIAQRHRPRRLDGVVDLGNLRHLEHSLRGENLRERLDHTLGQRLLLHAGGGLNLLGGNVPLLRRNPGKALVFERRHLRVPPLSGPLGLETPGRIRK